jgi:coenzyme F420-reducing hydrogenase alpha subunit
MSNENTFRRGDKVAYFGREAEIVIPDLGDAYWTRGARIRYTTGDRAGQLDDVPIADLRPLAEHETAAGKVRAAAEKAAAEHAVKMAGVRESLIAKAMAAVGRIVAPGVIDLHTLTKSKRDAIAHAVMIATNILNDAIVNEAIDRVREKTKKETT